MKPHLALFLLTCAPILAVDIYVSPSAKSGGDGSAAKPYATLEEARSAARQVRDQPVTVHLGGGRYMVREGFALSTMDSGTKDRRITYRAVEGETPELVSGVMIPAASLRPVTDAAILSRLRESVRDEVREVSLKDLGIQVQRFPDNFKGLELLELFSQDKRLPISRWPDNGSFAKISTVLDNGMSKSSPGTFVYREEGPDRWQAALPDGVWLRGFWRVPWVIEAVRISAIDPEKKTITLAVPVSGGIGSKYKRSKTGVGPGSGEEPWEAINLIEEISRPGEWAVRFDTQTLYILPPEGGGDILVTDHRGPILSLEDVSHLSIEGLKVGCGLGDGISVKGGEDVLVAGCHVGNVAQTGVLVRGGKNHTVLSCDVSETGQAGIDFLGGQRATLTPGGHRIMNNIVSRAGLYFPIAAIVGGISIREQESVGNYVAFNRIHDTSNSGVVYAGNDNIFEFNDVYRVGLGSNDLGSFYTTGGWTSRGNVVRYNFVHHSLNANAFYVDDGDSGDLFFGNVAYQTESGGFVGGGHDQIFQNNIVIESPRAMHVDSRGVSRNYTATDRRLRGDLDSVPYQMVPWSDKYPELVKILDTPPEYPSGILIENNLFVKCEVPIRWSGKKDELLGVTYQNNLESSDLGMFVDPENFDFALKPDAPVFTQIQGFQAVPFEKIGIYADSYRPVVPARDVELLKSGKTDRGFDSQTDIDASNR